MLDKGKQQRIIKICPYRWLSNYDVSVWVDGSIQVCKNISTFISQYDLDKCPLYTRVHMFRHCIYDEAEMCKRLHKDSAAVIDA
jgi:hypothetical protein